MTPDAETVSRAEGCLLGQIAGDSLGSLVESQYPYEIRRQYPNGVRELADGGRWGTIAGQPTDDSEMALVLARTLVTHQRYDAEEVRKAYVSWLHSGSFSQGETVKAGLAGEPNRKSQSNGALMRVSPLGIFCSGRGVEAASEYARQDAALTHPHPICVQANALFAMSIAELIAHPSGPQEIYANIQRWAEAMCVEKLLMTSIHDAADTAPHNYVDHPGWVVTALQNALWQLLHAPSLEEGVVDTVMRGGDTDTNAAIAGALLGAVYGRNAIPAQWTEKILACRPQPGQPHVAHPRPECFWPVDAPGLAGNLLTAGSM